MTATRAFVLTATVAAAAMVTNAAGFAAAGRPASVQLRTITSRTSANGTSLIIEASEPVAYVATRADELTLLLDFRNVQSDYVANRVPSTVTGAIAGVKLEVVDSMGTPAARLRVSLTQAVAHRIRSDRNNIIVEFDKVDPKLAARPTASGGGQAPDAMQALATRNIAPLDPITALGLGLSAPATVLPAGTAAFLALARAQQQPPPSVAGPATQNEPRKYTGALADWNLEDADLRGTLRLIQDISGLNMVFDPGITGKVDMVLTQVPWDQALDVVLKQNKLGYIVDDTIVRIAPLSTLADESAQRRKLADEQALSGQLIVANKTLSYAKAGEMAPLLTTMLSPRGQVKLDPRTNTLIIQDLPDRVKNITDLVQTLDRAEPQVEIEARIVQTTTAYARALGVQLGFGGQASPALGNTTSLAFPNNGSLGGRIGIVQGPNGAPTVVNLPADGATSAIGLALGSVNGAFNLDAALTALENNRQGKVLSTPKVTTMNNVDAEIAQGVQIPYQTTANNTVTTEFKDAALVLKVNPQITDAGTVMMRISVDKGSVGPIIGGIPSINTQRANTSVLVSDGETTVIGGIFEGDERRSSDSTPGLSRVPLLKWLFKRESVDEENRELLIFITPRIIRK